MQAADHRPVLGVQRGEQAGRPVTQVVVGALLGLLGHHQNTPAGSAPAATSVFDKPAAHLKTIQERNANAWADLRRRSHPTSCSRSRSINSRTALRRPVLGITKNPINLART